jgi:hypothetical protein
MNGLDAFKQNGGLNPSDLIRVSITGSRGKGAVEQISTYFDGNGIALNDNLSVKGGAVPLDVSAVAGAGGDGSKPPDFPTDSYQAAIAKGNTDEASDILKAHQQALTQFKAGGKSTVEDGIIDACLQYCYDHLKFSAVDDATKFVITRKDVVLSKEVQTISGMKRTVFEVRLASRFG